MVHPGGGLGAGREEGGGSLGLCLCVTDLPSQGVQGWWDPQSRSETRCIAPSLRQLRCLVHSLAIAPTWLQGALSTPKKCWPLGNWQLLAAGGLGGAGPLSRGTPHPG